MRHFWSATQSQIYTTLKRLTEDGLVSQEVIHQQERPDRKLYHITEAGREQLGGWLVEPGQVGGHRIEWLIKVFFADQLSNEEIAQMLEGLRQATVGRLQAMRDVVPPVIEESHREMESPRKRRLWELTYEYGQAMMAAQEEWLARTAAEALELPEE